MPLKKFLPLLFGFCISFSRVAAQEASSSISMPVNASASLLYDFPQSFGAQVGVEFPLNSRLIFINRKHNQKKKFREMLVRSDIGFYRYVLNNTGLFFQQSIGFRYHQARPYYFEWMLTVGALRTFYDGRVYSVNNEGVVRALPGFGRWYAITGITTGFGFDWERNVKPKPFAVAIKPSLWMQYPYNSFVLPHLSLQLSMQYHIPSFNRTIYQKSINRGYHL